MERQTSPSGGFTLVELMIALAVLSIVATLSAPSFLNLLSGYQQITERDRVVASLALARSEAATRGTTVALCAKAKTSYQCSTQVQDLTTWQHGWLVFTDNNQNLSLDSGELIRAYDPPAPAVTLTAGQSKPIRFDLRGRLLDDHGKLPNMQFKAEKTGRTNAIEVLMTGRMRLCDDWISETKQCVRN